MARTSSSFKDRVFFRAKLSPSFIPLLVYLHPPPTYSLTSSQADYWVQSLVAYYPEELKEGVLDVISMDPDRIIPLIPYILSKLSVPRIIPDFQVNDRGPDFTTLTGALTVRAPIPGEVDPENRPTENVDSGSQPFQAASVGLQTEIKMVRNVIAVHVDQDMYHLSISKMVLANMAYGFLLGAFSFLGLRSLSYGPHAAVIGSFPLAMALLLFFGIPV